MSYMQSKTFAEKAARDVASSLGVEIVTVHPSFVQATWLLFPHPRRRTYSACHGAGPDAAASRAGFGRRAQAAARRHGPRCTAWQRELVRRARRGRCSRGGAPCTPQPSSCVRADSRSPQRQLSPISTQALTHPDAAGRRYIVDSGSMLFTEIADEMRARFPEWRVPKWRAPWALVYLASFIDPQERANVAAALQAVAPG